MPTEAEYLQSDQKEFLFYKDIPDPNGPRTPRKRQVANYNENVLFPVIHPQKTPTKSKKVKKPLPPRKCREESVAFEPEQIDFEETLRDEDMDVDSSDEENHTPPKRQRTNRTASKSPLKRAYGQQSTPSKSAKSPFKSPSKSPGSQISPRRRAFNTLQNNIQRLTLEESFTVDSSSLEKARQFLWKDNNPDQLMFREKEIGQIMDFCQKAISKNSISSAMYLGGAPGTGKTSCVLNVLNRLKKKNKNFLFVNLNAGQMIRPEEVYVHFYKELFKAEKDKRISQQIARRTLNQVLAIEDKKRQPILLLVDEMDLLLTKNQSVLYDILNWSSIPEARVNVIAISNTFDLPQRALNKRVDSRLGTNMIQFHPYNYSQIEGIITARLKNCGGKIHDDAFKLCSRKVANMSGDIRKALDIIRHAIDIAIEDNAEQLLFSHVQKAVTEAQETYRVQIIRNFNSDQLKLFKCITKDLNDCGLDTTTFGRVYKSYVFACAHDHEEPLNVWQAMDTIKNGAGFEFYEISKSIGLMNKQIKLNFSTYEANFCLKELEKSKN